MLEGCGPRRRLKAETGKALSGFSLITSTSTNRLVVFSSRLVSARPPLRVATPAGGPPERCRQVAPKRLDGVDIRFAAVGEGRPGRRGLVLEESVLPFPPRRLREC